MASSSGQAFLLVDGHSVIFGDPELRRLHATRPAHARELLVARLRRHQDLSDERVVVVFDGRGRTSEEPRLPGAVQVIHAGDGTTADAVIERLCCLHGGKYRLTVVTDDRTERGMVTGFGAEWIGVSALAARLERAEREFVRMLKEREQQGGGG